MEVVDVIQSKVDKTIKYIFRLRDGLVSEVAYIDKDDGRDIICVGCQTACSCNCRFCHTSDALGKIRNRNLFANEIEDMVLHVRQERAHTGDTLVSYMGCGEPMKNVMGVLNSMVPLKTAGCRFAIATLIPEANWMEFFYFTRRIQQIQLPVKVHLSLHFIRDDIRKEWMPCALDVRSSLSALHFYRSVTKNPVELHYALVSGVNDSLDDARELAMFTNYYNFHVKLIKYNSRGDYKPSCSAGEFMSILTGMYISCEYYEPPGIDVGASCGQFLLDYYYRYNTIGSEREPHGN
jgi:23S rRNA (adenine2503-C2)-methyltransferase